MNTIKALDILALKSGTTKKEVKNRFRLLAKTHHPDATHDSSKEPTNSEFISIKNAYDYLTSLPNDPIIVREDNLISPQRRKYSKAIKIPDWIILKELRNCMALLKLLPFKWGIITLKFNETNKIKVEKKWNKYIHTISISILLLILAVATPLVAFSIALSFLLFYPLLWLYNTSVDYFITVVSKHLGFTASVSSARFNGGVIYLLTRSFPAIVICLLVLWISMHIYKHHSTIVFLGIVPMNIFTFILSTSVLYEWISFFKIRRKSFTK
ncbi:MAG: J domain-containing protein [Bacteroidia bacterium]|nr:J domain-containing protein [Bacteroidia bacterium]MBP7262320.1 J domain-containing protein [Bacteroidia bacterium]MBP9723532.1 J domain-containing protein [Bacteroidia bacterium]